MTTRELPPAEWDRLVDAGTELASVRASLDPAWARVLVVEDHGEIVACWSALTMRHVEGLWVRPDHQKCSAAQRRLWIGMRRLLGGGSVITGAATPEIAHLLERHGATRLPGQQYVLPMGDPCQQQSSAA